MAEERQFDFWIGDWDCRWDGGKGSNAVTAELDGAVILERFDGRPGTDLRGISISVFDAAAAEWRQAWADSTRSHLEFSGGLVDGEMILRRTASEEGRLVRYRMRFTEITDASFVWLWERERADDGGWELRWRIDYGRRS